MENCLRLHLANEFRQFGLSAAMPDTDAATFGHIATHSTHFEKSHDDWNPRVSPMIGSALPDSSNTAAWLCLCPLLAVASSWHIALALAVCLLVAIALTTGLLAAMQRFIQQTLRLPLAALVAGTVVVLEQLALAAWWPALDAAVAPWLVLVGGVAVLLCKPQTSIHGPGSRPIHGRDDEKAIQTFAASAKLALVLPAALLVIGIARDGFGRVFLIANTPSGALVLLALVLAGINFVVRDFEGSSQPIALSPLDSGLRRNDEQEQSTVGASRGDRDSA